MYLPRRIQDFAMSKVVDISQVPQVSQDVDDAESDSGSESDYMDYDSANYVVPLAPATLEDAFRAR